MSISLFCNSEFFFFKDKFVFVLFCYRYSSLGVVQKSPFFTNGRLQIEYQDGAMCTQNITTPHVKTTITFMCNLEATVGY